MTVPAQINLPMACACSRRRKAELDELVGDWTATQLLYELSGRFGYTVDYIGVDMWMGAKLSHWDNDEEYAARISDDAPPKPQHPPIRIEFDVLEHGLASVLAYLKEQEK